MEKQTDFKVDLTGVVAAFTVPDQIGRFGYLYVPAIWESDPEYFSPCEGCGREWKSWNDPDGFWDCASTEVGEGGLTFCGACVLKSLVPEFYDGMPGGMKLVKVLWTRSLGAYEVVAEIREFANPENPFSIRELDRWMNLVHPEVAADNLHDTGREWTPIADSLLQ